MALLPVVYTMGKVASSSVSAAIAEAGIGCPDIHSLRPHYLRRTARKWLERDEFPPPHICTAMANRSRFVAEPQRYLFISLVRDPIARNLSAYFQNLHLKPVASERDAQRLFDNFVDSYRHDIPTRFFEREYKGELGIDVFSTKFDKSALFVHVPKRSLLLFRVDCPDETKSAILSELLGREVRVGRENAGDDKDYRALYDSVKRRAVFGQDFVDRIYDSAFCRHFWTEDELGQFRRKWTQAAYA